MNKENIIEILSEVLIMNTDIMPTIDEEEKFLQISVSDPFDDTRCYYRYYITDEEKICVEQLDNDNISIRYVEKNLREIIWKSCKLERICAIYRKQYEKWKNENSGIPYIETRITDDLDGRLEKSFDFVRNFWKEEYFDASDCNSNMRLLLAEYGQGKSSCCQGIRYLVAQEIKPKFTQENAAFPFVFDLNRFRSGDFDKFIESELFRSYRMSMNYKTFERLCQNGYFMVVLDAWDQMRNARKPYQVNQDLKQMNSLWEKRGRVLITCRRSFYQQQLKVKENLLQNVGLYRLNGFDKEAATYYLCYCNKERRQKGAEPLVQNEAAWVHSGWELNSDLFEKPLNLKLLVKHFKTITTQLDFKHSRVETTEFLNIIYNEWKEKNNIKDDEFLKELISQTLYSGLNRSISLVQFQQACKMEKWEEILKALEKFDFINIDKREERIEFCLAAYQEFIWAHFALEELEMEPKMLHSANALIKHYLLIREVREWICTILGKKESDCLENQLSYLKYRNKEDVGYRCSNALTLLCDLVRIPYYKEQLERVKQDLSRRPLTGTDFRGMDLSNADFHNSNLEGANFSFTVLNGVDFVGTDLGQTIWNEHGEMKKCTFLNQKDTLCVVAGTHNGGVCTFNINDGRQQIIDLQNDVINDLAGDRGGIYTASSDGWVGYIDKNGNLKNAYIAQSGLQSIAHTNSENCVYIGADNQGIYRYNWNTGRRQKIEVNQLLGDGTDRISDLHYYSSSKEEDYIAYTLQEKRVLILLKLNGINKGEVVAKGILHTQGIKFGDICFADEMLVYSVIGKGIFKMQVKEVVGDISEQELLHERQSLLLMSKASRIFLGWAHEIKRLMVAVMIEYMGLNHIYSIDLYSKKQPYIEVELDWIYQNKNYIVTSEYLKGFSVSDDGEYIAFSGDAMMLFHKEGKYYGLSVKPIEAKISCKGADFSRSTGLSRYDEDFLKRRGAVFNFGRE